MFFWNYILPTTYKCQAKLSIYVLIEIVKSWSINIFELCFVLHNSFLLVICPRNSDNPDGFLNSSGLLKQGSLYLYVCLTCNWSNILNRALNTNIIEFCLSVETSLLFFFAIWKFLSICTMMMILLFCVFNSVVCKHIYSTYIILIVCTCLFQIFIFHYLLSFISLCIPVTMIYFCV